MASSSLLLASCQDPPGKTAEHPIMQLLHLLPPTLETVALLPHPYAKVAGGVGVALEAVLDITDFFISRNNSVDYYESKGPAPTIDTQSSASSTDASASQPTVLKPNIAYDKLNAGYEAVAQQGPTTYDPEKIPGMLQLAEGTVLLPAAGQYGSKQYNHPTFMPILTNTSDEEVYVSGITMKLKTTDGTLVQSRPYGENVVIPKNSFVFLDQHPLVFDEFTDQFRGTLELDWNRDDPQTTGALTSPPLPLAGASPEAYALLVKAILLAKSA
jgi:hypothetical protein